MTYDSNDFLEKLSPSLRRYLKFTAPTLEEAETELATICDEKGLVADFKVLTGDKSSEGDVITLNDIPVQFGTEKKYRDRRVTVERST